MMPEGGTVVGTLFRSYKRRGGLGEFRRSGRAKFRRSSEPN
jgi:hypothetical protein